MKDVIAIYTGWAEDYWDEQSVANGMPGSETWATEISVAFANKGYHVIIFGNPSIWHFDEHGVEYIPYTLMNNIISRQKIDYFIFSRDISPINAWIECPNIYVQLHDPHIIHLPNSGLKLDKIKKFCCISQWQKYNVQKEEDCIELTNDRFFKGINGVNQNLYLTQGLPVKKNQMVWSSACDRDFLSLMKYVIPKILQVVPDFKVHICYGFERVINAGREHIVNEVKDIMNQYPDTYIYHGNVSKKALADLQLESKVWFYSPIAQESFCITAVENALAMNALVIAPTFGFKDTLQEGRYPFFINLSQYDWENKVDSVFTKMANTVISLLIDEQKRIQHAKAAFNICIQYTWENAADIWINEWKNDKINGNQLL
jgi:hypothetical protein